jgi:pimeloyl-ACP methyl ester carboxylesterase
MEFERVAFDLPHGTFHALEGGDPDGQPTLVLHGFPDHPPTAKSFLAELGRRGRYVVAPWLRGYAPSPTDGPFDMAALTSDVLALIDRWSPERPVELVGHDWGGAITYDVCVTAPDRIDRAVTLAFPHPLTFLSRPRLAQLRRSWYMGLFQLPGSGPRRSRNGSRHGPSSGSLDPRGETTGMGGAGRTLTWRCCGRREGRISAR